MVNKVVKKKSEEIKQPRTLPKCLYANWKYCWQRRKEYKTYSSYQLQYMIDDKQCAACIAAQINWGDGADRRPLAKEEVQKELEAMKNGQSKTSA